jgi:hypothetical protein
LGRLVPTGKQDNQLSTSFGIVNPVSRTDVDLEFADPCSQPSVLAWISVCQPIDSNLDARSTLTVLERLEVEHAVGCWSRRVTTSEAL